MMIAVNLLIFLQLALKVSLQNSVDETGTLHSQTDLDEPSASNDPEQPLFLTPYTENGDIETARSLSKVGKLPNTPDVESYSGFFTVNEGNDTNMFFWFFPAMEAEPDAPVILWLQGGPGTSGLFGLFVEQGPYIIQSDMTVNIRPFTWAKSFHVIYVDNPVGAGFSFTDNDSAYSTNQESAARNLYEFLQQFFVVFYDYTDNDFYIVGESYGGKFAPSLAYKIHEEGSSSKINLKGIAIGNGYCDPEAMLDYSPYLYQLGLIDKKQADIMQNLSNSIREHIHRGDFKEAAIEADKMLLPFFSLPYTSYFTNITEFQYVYNYLLAKAPEDFSYFKNYVHLPQVRKAIHVGNLSFQNGVKAQRNLLTDLMKSVKPEITVLMDHYKVLFYNGQLDIAIPYPMTVSFLHSVEWKGTDDYKNAERGIWKLDDGSDRIAGYVHNVGDFFELLVRNAGHMVPHDQPEFALDLITRFIRGIPYA